jgi:hypothetical protein
MIRELEQSSGNILAFEIDGKVSSADQKAWIARFDETLRQHDKVRALVVLGQGAGWGLEAGIEDVKWVMHHLKQLDKIAFVSDSKVWKWLIAMDSQFAKLVSVREKHFTLSEMDAAWRWIRQ